MTEPSRRERLLTLSRALIRAQKALDALDLDPEQQAGVNIIKRAIEEPLRRISENAGVEGSIVVDKVKGGSGSFGFNAQTEEYGDLIEAGVIDPTKVVRTALQNAASVAALLLTTQAMVAEKPEKKGAAGGGMPGGMPDMDM